MTNSQNATSKCFSGTLRRLLCTGNLPTHPSDHFVESKTTDLGHPQKSFKAEAQAHVRATPGVVARLMGLDSLPDINKVPKERTLDSILRSRSVNFVDYLPQFDLTQAVQHRRVRTSVSFREVPTFLRQQDRDFLVICSEKVDETNKKGLNVRKPEVGFQEVKQKKVERSKNNDNIRERVPVKKENQEKKKKKACKRKDELKIVAVKSPSKVANITLKVKNPVKPMNSKKVCVGSELTKKKKNGYAAKKVKSNCKSENSSPVSVLGLHNFHLERPVSEDSGLTGLNWRKKSSPKLANCDYPCPNLVRLSNSSDDQELRAMNTKADKPVKSTPETDDYYIKLISKICSLTEKEIHVSNWVAREVFKIEDFEEICLEFGQQILELLLNQVVDELVVPHMMKNLAL